METKINILYDSCESNLTVEEFLDPVGLFSLLVEDGVETVNLTIYQWDLNHQWHDSNGGNWRDVVRKYHNLECYIVSDVENTFDYGLVWYLE